MAEPRTWGNNTAVPFHETGWPRRAQTQEDTRVRSAGVGRSGKGRSNQERVGVSRRAQDRAVCRSAKYFLEPCYHIVQKYRPIVLPMPICKGYISCEKAFECLRSPCQHSILKDNIHSLQVFFLKESILSQEIH